VTNDDLLYRHRLLVFAKAAEVGVSQACRALGDHRSWFYRWKGLNHPSLPGPAPPHRRRRQAPQPQSAPVGRRCRGANCHHRRLATTAAATRPRPALRPRRALAGPQCRETAVRYVPRQDIGGPGGIRTPDLLNAMPEPGRPPGYARFVLVFTSDDGDGRLVHQGSPEFGL
jgi:hypothetical protein